MTYHQKEALLVHKPKQDIQPTFFVTLKSGFVAPSFPLIPSSKVFPQNSEKFAGFQEQMDSSSPSISSVMTSSSSKHWKVEQSTSIHPGLSVDTCPSNDGIPGNIPVHVHTWHLQWLQLCSCVSPSCSSAPLYLHTGSSMVRYRIVQQACIPSYQEK